ncbi:MAG: 4Fe-4S binding protein [Anaerolineales bacterium]|nr:4Fe-4S binding protein [Anaerolineales bacterium]
MDENPYKNLAKRLDEIPNGYPATEDGVELKLLEWLFTRGEATLGAELRLTKETPAQIAERIDGDPKEIRKLLRGMAKKGLVTAGRTEGGLGFGLMPFAVGIYEMQFARIDDEMAHLFEDYYFKNFGKLLNIKPYVHRVVPINENVKVDMEIKPYESATEIVNNMKSWGVVDCLCRMQQEMVGDPCDHPKDVCMVVNEIPGVFDRSPIIRNLTHEEALATLKKASDAGLVHSVSNSKEGLWYICNCCTCSCGILRAMAELGIANVVARSAFVLNVDEDLCMACGDCVEECQFDALELDFVSKVNKARCVGCGACVNVCLENALTLVRRPEEEIKPPYETEMDWMEARADIRGIDINKVL